MEDQRNGLGSDGDLKQYLIPTRYIDCDHPDIRAFAADIVEGAETEREKAVKLYYAARDEVRYDPYAFGFSGETFKGSNVLAERKAFCVPKAILLTTLCRAQGIPARLGFADVRNHLASDNLIKMMQTDVFAFHGYSEIYLEGKWVKATPAFNREMCERFNVLPLEFDGLEDSVFHPFDGEGQEHMEYLKEHGHFADFPPEGLVTSYQEHYPHFFDGVGADMMLSKIRL
ncbi:MAG: transglutaminase family protein [Gammaproteobacteria bacterium]|nr:transglutaminase family protein [Gammaproteobacteria bacterium]